MSEGPKQRRHWLRWSLLTLFVLVTISALIAAWIASAYRIASARRRYLYVNEVNRISSAFDPAKNELSFWRRYFGDTSMMSIWLRVGSTAADIDRAQRLFPEAEIHVMYYSHEFPPAVAPPDPSVATPGTSE